MLNIDDCSQNGNCPEEFLIRICRTGDFALNSAPCLEYIYLIDGNRLDDAHIFQGLEPYLQSLVNAFLDFCKLRAHLDLDPIDADRIKIWLNVSIILRLDNDVLDI